MRFYDRKDELKLLQLLDAQAGQSGKMTVITGRRRVGKTRLSIEFSNDKKYLYLFVSKKSESLLCAEFMTSVKAAFHLPVIGEIKRFADVFKVILQIAEKEQVTLIIDEFQEFFNINPSVFSDIQNLWDLNKDRVRVHLIFIGSVYSLMFKIFQDSHEPLFGRADRLLYLNPFKPKTIKEILEDYGAYSARNLFAVYIITGGMPKYLDILTVNKAFTREDIFSLILQKDSPFLFEGKNLLIEELGRDYGTYFSILELMSASKTSRGEIESIIGKNVGGYLNRLEDIYAIISKVKPFNAKKTGRLQKYRIKDNFLNFWFRFIHRNRSAVETENFAYIQKILDRDFDTYSGFFLEKLFQELIGEKHEYNRIGNYWEKGNANEIDIVAVNDLDKKMLIAEVKLNAKRINIDELKVKSKKLLKSYQDYRIQYLGLSLDDLGSYF